MISFICCGVERCSLHLLELILKWTQGQSQSTMLSYLDAFEHPLIFCCWNITELGHLQTHIQQNLKSYLAGEENCTDWWNGLSKDCIVCLLGHWKQGERFYSEGHCQKLLFHMKWLNRLCSLCRIFTSLMHTHQRYWCCAKGRGKMLGLWPKLHSAEHFSICSSVLIEKADWCALFEKDVVSRYGLSGL